jgi:pyruvate dehydrogenase E2 component (dihydrolipoamide acetyltransferase)
MNAPAQITMPRLSDSMEEGTLLRWIKRDGDAVDLGEELAEIESDKATVIYEAQAAGVLSTAIEEGATVAVGTVIGWLGSAPKLRPVPARAAVRRKASPVARRIAATHGIDLALIEGTGPDGRVLRADVELRLTAPERLPAPEPRSAPEPPSSPEPLSAPEPPSSSEPAPAVGVRGDVTIHPLTRLQSLVAERMARSRDEIPDFEVRVRVDAEPLLSVREQLRAGDGVDLPSVNDFVVKAAARALREQPGANATYRGDTWERYARVNIGVAVATEGGLIVPTVFDADGKSLGEISRLTRELAARAREGRITPRDLDGATFTVSNLGMFGIDGFSAVISPGQAAILAVGAAAVVPVVRDGAVVPGRQIELALSCDHRVIYGADAARLLSRIRDLLEHPLTLLVA